MRALLAILLLGSIVALGAKDSDASVYGDATSCELEGKVPTMMRRVAFGREVIFLNDRRSFHFIQLRLHHRQLFSENDRSNDTNKNKSQGEQANAARPLRQHALIDWMLGCVFLGATAAAVFIAFKGAEYADDYWGGWYWIVPFGLGIALAFFFADHALSIAL